MRTYTLLGSQPMISLKHQCQIVIAYLFNHQKNLSRDYFKNKQHGYCNKLIISLKNKQDCNSNQLIIPAYQ